MMDEQVRCAEQRIADVRDHYCPLVQKGIEPLEKAFDRHFVFAANGGQSDQRLWSGNPRGRAPGQLRSQQAVNEVLEADIFIAVVANREFFARRIDRARRIELCGVNAEVDVGHERAEEDDAIAGLDVATHVVAAHRTLVNAHVKAVLLTDDRFAHDGCRDRDVGLCGEPYQGALQPEPMHFHVGQDDRLARAINHCNRLRQRLAQCVAVALLVKFPRRVMRNAGQRNQVTRQLDVNGTLVTQRRVQHAIDFLKGALRIAQDGGSNGQLLENLFLGVELAHLVVEQRILFPFLHPRRAADDHDRRFLCERFGRGVGHLQSADAIGDADGAQSAHTGVGVGRKTSALFIASIDNAKRAVKKLFVKAEHVIAGDAKNVPHAMRVKSLNQIFADARRLFHDGLGCQANTDRRWGQNRSGPGKTGAMEGLWRWLATARRSPLTSPTGRDRNSGCNPTQSDRPRSRFRPN